MESSHQKRNSPPKRDHGACGESSQYRTENETSYFLSLMDSHREITILTRGSRRMAFCRGNRSLLSIFRKLASSALSLMRTRSITFTYFSEKTKGLVWISWSFGLHNPRPFSREASMVSVAIIRLGRHPC